jgi:hypothetical protein
LRLAVDGEHHQADLAFAVIGDGLGNRGSPARTEVLVGSPVVFLALIVKGVPAAALGMRVDVDGDQVGVIHGGLRSAGRSLPDLSVSDGYVT